MPSMTRVVMAAMVTIALAAGTLVLVKRVLPRYTGRVNHSGDTIKVLARTSISRSLSAHLIEVDATRVLVVEGRTGIELTVLPRPVNSEPQART
jgi:hypothetical protein